MRAVGLEAALAGAPLVGHIWARVGVSRGRCLVSSPGDANSLRKAVLAAWEAGRHHPRAIRMKRKVLERFNWERTVDATEKLYRRVLDAKKQLS